MTPPSSVLSSELVKVRVGAPWLDEAGVWRAVVRYGDRSVMVDRELGSWRVSPVADGVGWQDLRPEHAEVLQQLVRREERAARRAAA